MASKLDIAVNRFCAQLVREGYKADRERIGDVYAIFACDEAGEVVQKYLAGHGKRGVRIEEVCETDSGGKHAG